MRLISVVLPVYNESESIGPCLRGLASALASEDHEILVCYDSEEDTTLPAIAAMSDRSPHVRLVRNTIGRGALNAIRTGFQAARGDVVVTSMADLSDPPAVILEMAKAIRSGADVVSGSRYMRGGSQTGGPWLKRTLSRIAGVSLRWIAGVGTHDATSNFRGYSRAFLDGVTIESRGGFEIALELTVKAHLAGRVVTEVPSSWIDRSAGKSNFRLWRWMPSYLRWYLRAMAEPLLAGAVWLSMAILATAYVAKFGSPDPLGDDLEMAPFFAGLKPPSLAWLWSQHNEHRIPIARVLLLAFMKLTGDVRSGMGFQVIVLALVSLAAMLVARRVRGRTRISDAFFPLLLLHTGNSFNLLMGFQLALVLPVALACAIPLILGSGPPALSSRRGLWIGLCAFALPLNGGAGISQALPIAVWMAAAGIAERRTSKALLAAGFATLALFGAYFLGFHFPATQVHSPNLGCTLETASQVLALAFGPAAKSAWPYSGAAIGIVLLATLALLASTFLRNPAERVRAAGLLACIGGSIALALSIGFGRGSQVANVGFATRYVTLTAPLLVTIFFAWLRLGPGATRTWVPLLLFCLGAAFLWGNVRDGKVYGEVRAPLTVRLDADVRDGMSIPEIAADLGRNLYPNPAGAAMRLEALHRAGLPPFRGYPYEANDAPPEPEFTSFRTIPDRVVSPRKLFHRMVAGTRALLATPPCELWFRLPPGAHEITGRFGILPEAIRRGRADAVRFTVERIAEGASPVVLFERVLDPKQRSEDGGTQELRVALPEGGSGSIVLRTSGEENSWPYWSDVWLR